MESNAWNVLDDVCMSLVGQVQVSGTEAAT